MNYCTPCEEAGRSKVAAIHQVGEEWMCQGCFLGDDKIAGVERRCKCGRQLSSYAKEGELCPSGAAPLKVGPKPPTPSNFDTMLAGKGKAQMSTKPVSEPRDGLSPSLKGAKN